MGNLFACTQKTTKNVVEAVIGDMKKELVKKVVLLAQEELKEKGMYLELETKEK